MRALRELTTLKVGGVPEKYTAVRSLADLDAVHGDVRQLGSTYLILGGGSNVLARDSIPSWILRVQIPGLTYEDQGSTVLARVGAGVVWDDFVADTVERGYWGVENLSGIPGLVGATPIQNVGAYGQEVRDVIESVCVYNLAKGILETFSNEQCGFGYRSSYFARNTHPYFITEVVFLLYKEPKPFLKYKDLQQTFHGFPEPSQMAIRDAVITIRGVKFPDLTRYGTAGSFFKNPFLSREEYTRLRSRFPGLSGMEVAENVIKVPLAHILDVLGYRGYRKGNVGLFEHQPIVLLNYGGATFQEVDVFANEIEQAVFDATNIRVEREVKNFPQF